MPLVDSWALSMCSTKSTSESFVLCTAAWLVPNPRVLFVSSLLLSFVCPCSGESIPVNSRHAHLMLCIWLSFDYTDGFYEKNLKDMKSTLERMSEILDEADVEKKGSNAAQKYAQKHAKYTTYYNALKKYDA